MSLKGIEPMSGSRRKALCWSISSTPVSRAVVPRALQDGINVLTMFHGRSDATDSETFPTIFPRRSLQSQAAVILSTFQIRKGKLKGKKIAFVGIIRRSSEPVPV